MSRDGSGNYSRAAAAPSAGQTISSTNYNSELNDIASALTASLAKDGQTTPSANLPMGTYKHTGVAAASGASRTEYVSGAVAQDGGVHWCSTAGGTGNAITLTPTPSIAAYAAGQVFRFIAGANNTSTVTVAVSGLTTKAVQKGAAALASGDIDSGKTYEIVYDGTAFQLSEYSLRGEANYPTKGSDLASASSLTLSASEEDQYFDVTGTTSITSISSRTAGRVIVLKFEGILTLTHHSTDLILPTGANITTAVGDVAVFVSEGSGDWRCISYTRASGAPLVSALTRTVGNTITQNPYAINATVTGAHGLAGAPTEVRLELECIDAGGDLGYAQGAVVQLQSSVLFLSGSSTGLSVQWDATDVTVISANNVAVPIPHASTRAMTSVTASKWELNIIPIRIA